MTTFGERLKQWRQGMRWTRGEMAEKLGSSEASVGNWEADRCLPGAGLLALIAEVGCDLNWLVAGLSLAEKHSSKTNDYAVGYRAGVKRAADVVQQLNRQIIKQGERDACE